MPAEEINDLLSLGAGLRRTGEVVGLVELAILVKVVNEVEGCKR